MKTFASNEGTPFVVALEALRPGQQGLVGGKAANLAVMMNARLPVPPGFCVTVAAFNAFLDSCRTRDNSWRTLSGLTAVPPGQATEFSTRLTACLADVPMPPQVQEAVLSCWRKQGQERAYAVRSSATVEDTVNFSFAGQFESFLNVRGRDALLGAVKRCWLSLFSARALVYQSERGLSPEQAGMAVVVQEMVPAEAAGVLFTADPVSGSARRMIVEATTGLGDQLASGRASPEHITLDKATLRVIQRQPETRAPPLGNTLVRRLGKLGRQAERLFRGPQDLEWAMANGKLFLLQTRPITSTGANRSWEDRQVWSNLNAGEVAPDVMTPVTWSVISLFLPQIARSLLRMAGVDVSQAPFFGLVAGRIYFNVNTGLAAMKPLPRVLLQTPNLAQALGGAQISPGFAGSLRIPDEDLPDLGFRWLIYLWSWPRIAWDLITHSPSRGDAWTARLKASNYEPVLVDLASQPQQELLRRLGRILEEGFWDWDLLFLVSQAAALLVFQKACRDWLDDPDLTRGYRLFAGLGGIPETEAGLALWRLADRANKDGEIRDVLRSEDKWVTVRTRLALTAPGREFLAGWDAFMAEHGHHCRGELELFNPRWSETPDYILGIVRGYLRAIHHTRPPEKQSRLAQEREQLTAQCRQRLRNPIKRWIFSRSLHRAQTLAVNREEWKNQAVRRLAVLRQILLVLGERLAREGILPHPADIFFLEVSEMEAVAASQARFDVTTVIQKRRAEYEMNLTLTPPPVVRGRFDPNTQMQLETDTDARILKGIPIFPGVITGLARVILRADNHEQVLPGEILIAPFTDPAWTPYLVTAAGVVMDQGGILSHGSIVAREFGLPAVTNVSSATRVIRTGDLVQVDGNSGQVMVLERAERVKELQ